MKWQLRTKLKELHRQFEHTMIYVTHDQTEALTFADKVVVMYEGEVVQIGTPEELFDEPAHTFVGYFIGSPGMNVLTADLQKNQAKLGSHVIELGKSYPDLDGTIELGIRPEFVSLGNDPLGVPVQVTAVEDIGRYKIVRTQLEGQALDAVIPEGQSVPAEPRAILDKSRINIYRDSHLVREGV